MLNILNKKKTWIPAFARMTYWLCAFLVKNSILIFRRRFLFWLVLGISLTGSIIAHPPQQLSMDDVVQKAMQHNPDLEALRYAERAAQIGANGALAGHLPTVGLESVFSKEPGQKSVKSATALRVNQLIFSFSGPLQQYQQAKTVMAIAGFEKEAQANQLRLETEKAFLLAWLLQEQKNMVQARNDSAESGFKRQTQKKNLGQLDHVAWLNDVAEYSDRLVSVENYGYDHESVLKKLEFFMGDSLELGLSVKLLWEDKKDYHLKSLNAHYHLALMHRPEVAKSIKEIAREEWNMKLASGVRLPILSAGAHVDHIVTPAQDTPGVIFGADTEVIPQSSLKETCKASNNFWQLSLTFSMPIFDGLVSHYHEQQAQAEKAKALCKREQVVLSVKNQVQEKYFMLLKLLKQLRTHKAYYLRTGNEFKVMQQKYQLGKISPVEFDVAFATWQKTQFDYLEHKVGIAMAERELLYTCGYPTEVLL